MSVVLTVNNTQYFYPEVNDVNWGNEATDWASAVTSGMLQKAGGAFTLLAETDFGPTYGLKSAYFKSRATNTAAAGQVRLGNDESLSWRNAANGADLALKVNSSNILEFNGVALQLGPITVSDTATIDLTLTGVNITAAIVALSIDNTMISASAAIALTKLAATTVSRAIVSDGSGFLVPATTTATEIGYVNGVTSSIQTQINSKQATGNYITALTGDVTASGPGSAAATISNLARTKLASGTAYRILANDVSGVMSENAAITTSRAVVSDANGQLVAATTTATEVGYLSGVTSAIQTQLNAALLNPMTTGGDIIYGGASGVPTKLSNGSSGQYLKSNGGTNAPSWQTLTTPTIQVFTSGSGTYTTPANVRWIRVRMVGGGGGGRGSGSSGAGSGGTGGNTTFGTTLLVANGGTGATGPTTPGTGGTASLGTGPIGIARSGADGGSGTGVQSVQSGAGAGTPFSGSPTFGSIGTGVDGKANTGNGGSGGGAGASFSSGAGGGAGGYVEANISSPLSTYAYVVGAAGTAGIAGTGGSAGGLAGSGYIIVEEFYQ